MRNRPGNIYWHYPCTSNYRRCRVHEFTERCGICSEMHNILDGVEKAQRTCIEDEFEAGTAEVKSKFNVRVNRAYNSSSTVISDLQEM